MTHVDLLVEQAKTLSAREKAELVARVSELLQTEIPEPTRKRTPLRGILADLGPAPSAEDIDEVRQEVWKNFPREDI
ncbi:MAG: hypothetical protein GC179_26940 [Anaerolineaceae bacterium]|nr:hypothetical protein [Anaerolineaceae bacterium]